jgi:hypothetical protein
MSSAGSTTTGSKVRISFETDVEVARCLKDLVKHYKRPIADVLAALICFEHESIEFKKEPENEFVQEPRRVKW